MNAENQKFIEDFKVRTSGFQNFNLRVHNLHNHRVDINQALSNLCQFLSKKVMGKSTSSLIRTDVELPYTGGHSNSSDYIRKITVNHKGLGTMRERKQSSSGYSQTFSDEMRDEEVMEVLTNPVIRDAVKADLLKKNSYKCLRYFNDACGAEAELIALKVLSDKYNKSIKEDFSEPQTILETTVGREYNDRDKVGEHKIDMKSFVMTTIRINRDDRIVLDTTSEDETDKSVENETYLTLSFNDIETAMVLMQIPDELGKTLMKIEGYIGKDYDETKRLESEVKQRLAVYAMMEELTD